MAFEVSRNVFTAGPTLINQNEVFAVAKPWRNDPDEDLYTVSGIALCHRRGPGVSDINQWQYHDMLLPVGPLWRGPLIQASASVSLASIENWHDAVNAGWAVDDVQWRAIAIGGRGHRIRIESRLAVRDTDGFLDRVAFHVTALGILIRDAEGRPVYP